MGCTNGGVAGRNDADGGVHRDSDLPTIKWDDTESDNELTRIIDGIIGERIRLALENNKQNLLLKTTEMQLEKEKSEAFWKRISLWAKFFNTWSWISAFSFLVFFMGVTVGINVLPRGVVCRSEFSLCYWLRWDNRKTTPPE